jgi:phosphatidylglycerol:prolipoprotein diacylglycerol transferase
MLTIGVVPVLFNLGPLAVGWVTLTSLIGIVVAVWLALTWARTLGISVSGGYGVALRAMVWGLVGARLFHVLDHWDFYRSAPWQTVYLQTGGLSLWGAIIVGAAGAALYARAKGMAVRKLADLVVPALLFGQMIGRLGDLLVGERLAKATSLPWSVSYSHPGSASYQTEPIGLHPVAAYELLWDAVLLGVLWHWRAQLRPDGMLFATYMMGYAAGRLLISFVRLDPVLVGGLQQAQVIAVAVLLLAGLALYPILRSRSSRSS